MTIANSVNKYYVYKTYNKIADWFNKNRSLEFFEKDYIDLALSFLSKDAKILSLGCGTGKPIEEYLLNENFYVTCVDGSNEMLNLAKINLSKFENVEFILSDMREINLNKKFDFIIAWHSFFHLPQEDQRKMFKLFANHINAGGILIFTSGIESGEILSDNGGQQLYHSSLSTEEYTELLTLYNFKIVKHVIEDSVCGDATVWVAKM